MIESNIVTDAEIKISIKSISTKNKLYTCNITSDNTGNQSVTLFKKDKELFSINNKESTNEYHKDNFISDITDLIDLLNEAIKSSMR